MPHLLCLGGHPETAMMPPDACRTNTHIRNRAGEPVQIDDRPIG